MNRNGRKIALGLIVIILGAGVLLKVIPPETDLENDQLASFRIDGSLVSNPLDLSERVPVLTPVAAAPVDSTPPALPTGKSRAPSGPLAPLITFGPGNSDVSEGGSGAPGGGTSNLKPGSGLPPTTEFGFSPLPPIVTGGGSGGGASGGGRGSNEGGASNPGSNGGSSSGGADVSGPGDTSSPGTPSAPISAGDSPSATPSVPAPIVTPPVPAPSTPPANPPLPPVALPVPGNSLPGTSPDRGTNLPPTAPLSPAFPDLDPLLPAIDLPHPPVLPGYLGGTLPTSNSETGGNLPEWPSAPAESGRPSVPHGTQSVPEAGGTIGLMLAGLVLLLTGRHFDRRSFRRSP